MQRIQESVMNEFIAGIKACVPTMLGYLGIGFAAGVVEKGVGLSLIEIALLSLIVYAGSAQFIICGLLVMQGPLSSIVITVFLVNLRHLLMSLSVAGYFRKEKWYTVLGLGTLLTDESYGVLTTSLQEKQPVTAAWTNGLNVAAYLTWLIANLLGGLFGQFIPDPAALGLDFALTAMFLGLFLFQVQLPLKKRTAQTLSVLLVVVGSLVLLMRITTGELAVIGATLLSCMTGTVLADD